jgi:hypothetical protein
VQHVGTEELLQLLRRGQRVLEHVVQQADGDAGRVHPHLGQDRGDLERVHQVRLARGARLALVLHCGEDVRLAQQLQVRARVVALDGLVDVFEADRRERLRGHVGLQRAV